MTAVQSLTLANTFVHTTEAGRAPACYRDVLGFAVRTGVPADDFRWLTTPTRPEVEIPFDQIGSGALPTTATDSSVLTGRPAKRLLTALICDCDDVDAVFETVRACGAEVPQPDDPSYGVRDCAVRDPDGNTIRFPTGLSRG